MANSIRFGAFLDDHVSSSLSKIRDNFDRMGKGAASASLIGNVGAMALGAGINLAGRAVGALADLFGDSARAAIEDERSIQRLATSLKANIPNWNGNTAAIEATLAARMKLGFADEDSRASMALLVGATHDVNKALAIQSTAMDLARFKGISLQDASEALTRVEAGSYRILKSLGIVLKEGATQTEALAAVTAVANGQAADFAKTQEGQLLVSQVKVNEAMEKFGKASAPIMVGGANLAADAMEDLVLGIDVVAKATAENRDNDIIATFLWGSNEENALKEAKKGFTSYEDSVRGALVTIAAAEGTAEKSSLDWAAITESANARASAAWGKLKNDIKSDAQSVIDQAFAPLVAKENLAAANSEVAAARRVLASATASKAEKADARSTILAAQQDQARYLLTLAQTGQTNNKAYKDGIASLKKSIAAATGPTKTALQDTLAWILKVEAAGKIVPINIRVGLNSGNIGIGGARAEGGPIDPGKVYKVGERGPEWFVSNDAGTIYPNGYRLPAPVLSGGGGSSGGGGVPVSIPIYIDGREIARVTDENLFYRQLTSPRV